MISFTNMSHEEHMAKDVNGNKMKQFFLQFLWEFKSKDEEQ